MKKIAKFYLLTVTLCCLVGAYSADAAAVITFANGDTFDDDSAGGTAGPFTDPVPPGQGTITTTAVAPSGVVNTTAGQLGINAVGADTADRFDDGESWSFSWDVNSQFAEIDFGLYSTAAEDLAFSVQSAAWVGLSITPGSANVIFSSGTGTFTFDDGTASDIFTSTDLYGVGAIPTIGAGTSITIAYAPGAAETAALESMSFNLFAPEPSTAAMLTLGGVLAYWRRRR